MVGIGIGVGLDSVRSVAAAPAGPSNLIDNGTFDDDSGWTLVPSAVIENGKLSATAGSGTAARDTNAVITENLFYEVSLTVLDMAGGGVQPSLGGAFGVLRTTDGVYSEYIRAGATQEFLLSLTATASVDDVSVEGPVVTPLDTELSQDVGFDDAGVWTTAGSNSSVAASAFTAAGGIGTKTARSAPKDYPLNAGTYEVVWTVDAYTNGVSSIAVCGISSTGHAEAGTFTEQIVVVEANTGTQTLGPTATSNSNHSVSSLSVKKIA